MLARVLMGTVAAACCAVLMAGDSNEDVAKELIAKEHAAMDGWIKGDPAPSLAVMDPEITLFHIMTGTRLDGLERVKELYESYRGRPLFDSYEILQPKVQVSGDAAVFTYVFVYKRGDTTSRWNSTQVYRRGKDGWRVIHAHWSVNQT